MTEDRELDAKVATLMGWTDIRIMGGTLAGHPPDKNGWWPVLYYSINIAAAWTVVEWLRAQKGSTLFTVTISASDNYRCEITCFIDGGPDWKICETADTAPRAICLAALKAEEHGRRLRDLAETK